MDNFDVDLNVYVPVVDLITSIKKGSAIVEAPYQDGFDCIVVYYEGNTLDFECLDNFADKLIHAAGRAIKKYPTIAKQSLKREVLIKVGHFNLKTNRFSLLEEKAGAFNSWLN